MKNLLVIDDEPSHRLMIRAVTEDSGWQVFEAASGEEGIAFVSGKGPRIQVALVDMNMPGIDGQTTLERLHKLQPGLPVILLTAYGTVGTAVEAMKRGAFDYLTKPADNDELNLTLHRAWEYNQLFQENERLRTELSGENALSALVGSGFAMRQVHEFIRQAGPSEATVLIIGESGTGKERIAEALHAIGSRNTKPLIKVNCAALPAQLLESELFGYERGAFTGAVKDKPGRFQLASGGTLFLDEIGEIPLDLQAKLLRALQERVIEPLGSVRPRPVDVRILAATNRDLRNAVAAGTFREDLFFRLNVLEIEAPPLRQRLEDLPLLVSRLLTSLAEKNKKNVRSVSPAFLQYLAAYPWPGNVRELENVLERALVLSRSDILDIDALPPQIRYYNQNTPEQQTIAYTGINAPYAQAYGQPAATMGYGQQNTIGSQTYGQINHTGGQTYWSQNHPLAPAYTSINPEVHTNATSAAQSFGTMANPERDELVHALEAHSGHRERTADSLGISRRTLQYKLKKFGLNKRG